MAHAIWSGAINFGLVTIPVKLFTAVKTDDLSFNMLHKKDEGRIKYERVCSVDGIPVPWDEIVKGYEYEKGQYVLLTDEDFAKVNPEAFVELDKISPMFFDKPYYLEPTKQGRHAYALLREALADSNRVAVARVVIRTKEYIAAVKPIGDALVLELMHWASEIVASDTLDLPGAEKLPEKEMQMARMLIDTMSVDEFEPQKFSNNYHDQLLTMIEARAAGKELPKAKKAPARSKVVNLMDVLAQSLEASKKRRSDANGKPAEAKRRKKTAA
jgi:DNA end-binding protein Ku